MPTPFQHLNYALALRQDPALPAALQACLEAAPGAFLLGNTAGDVQAITGQPRIETHFYAIPPSGDPRATEALLAAHPALAAPHALAPDRAAFVSGYLAHLVYDEVWAEEVYCPLYLYDHRWPDRLTRSVHHNALRVWLDRRAVAALQTRPEVVAELRQAAPEAWLPFVADAALRRWRDWLLEQLEHPERIETLPVFAGRMGISVQHLEETVQTIAGGSRERSLPGLGAALARFEARARDESLEVLARYWEPAPALAHTRAFCHAQRGKS